MSDKYLPLNKYLIQSRNSGRSQVEVLFEELDRMVGGLPPSAREHRPWWANSQNTQAAAWLSAGWRVATVDLDRQRVTFAFAKEFTNGEHEEDAPPSTGPTRRANFNTVDLESLVVLERCAISIDFDWLGAGEISLDISNHLTFPRLPKAPGIYRISIGSAVESSRLRCYFGETDNLFRRMGQYRRPGPTQPTNIRLNGLLRSCLADGARAELAFCVAATIDSGDSHGHLDLRRKAARLLVENAALSMAHQADVVDIENLG